MASWIGEATIWGTAFYFAAWLEPGFWPAVWVPVALVVGWCLVQFCFRRSEAPNGRNRELLRQGIELATFSAVWIALLRCCGRPWSRSELAIAGWSSAAIVCLRFCRRPTAQNRLNELSRTLGWLLVWVAGLWLLRGLARPTLHGASDALWYGTMIADAIAQFRTWHFPLWTGQSIYQFNGAIYPLRVAPAFLYLGALLDLLTLRSLGVFALQNLLLTLIGLATITSAFVCLAALLPGRRWLAAGLAILFLACPGVLGLVYNSDLYMSWTTLPWIPVVWWAGCQSFRDRGRWQTLALLGASLGFCWWGHSPIALWSTLFAAAIQLVRLVQQWRGGIDWVGLIGGAAAFIMISGYPIGSLVFFPPEAGVKAYEFQRASAGNIYAFIESVFPRVLLPLSHNGRALSDFQLGYSLWALLLIGMAGWARRPRTESGLALAIAGLLAMLLTPIPGVTLKVWTALPDTLRDTTGNWVMNRLYVPLAGAAVFAAALSLSERRPMRIGGRITVALGVAAACLWSVADAGKFVRGSREGAPPASSALAQLRTENVKLTRFSYLVFSHWPATFTHGVTDPALENRLRERRSFALIADDADVARRVGRELAAGEFAKPSRPGDYRLLDRKLRIESGQHYLLEFDFAATEVGGVLQIFGPSLFREYGLPEYGGPLSFGAGGRHSDILPLWTTAGAAEDITVRLIPPPSPSRAQASGALAHVALLHYDPARLPIRVESWIPYTANVTSPRDAWLETPRMFLPGYTATLNGRKAVVTRSPEGLTCVAVPAGESHVELTYRPPGGLEWLFWIALAGMGATACLALPPFRVPLTEPDQPK